MELIHINIVYTVSSGRSNSAVILSIALRGSLNVFIGGSSYWRPLLCCSFFLFITVIYPLSLLRSIHKSCLNVITLCPSKLTSAIKTVTTFKRSGNYTFIPSNWEKVYYQYEGYNQALRDSFTHILRSSRFKLDKCFPRHGGEYLSCLRRYPLPWCRGLAELLPCSKHFRWKTQQHRLRAFQSGEPVMLRNSALCWLSPPCHLIVLSLSCVCQGVSDPPIKSLSDLHQYAPAGILVTCGAPCTRLSLDISYTI